MATVTGSSIPVIPRDFLKGNAVPYFTPLEQKLQEHSTLEE